MPEMKHSPMFKHAIESFEHALEHFLDGTDRSRKFALLHMDHAVELMLKERCVQLGKSIYKSDGTTLTLHETFRSLGNANVTIPEQPRLEDLHDLRNTIQHKGLVPDNLTAQFHVEVAYNFIKRFLQAELQTAIDNVIPKRYKTLIEGSSISPEPGASVEVRVTPPGGEEISRALREAREAENAGSKVVAGYSILQQAVRYLAGAKSDEEKVRFRTTLRNSAVANGTPQKKVDERLQQIFILRGQVLKGDYEASESDAALYLQAVEWILHAVGYDVTTPPNGGGDT